MSNGIKKVRYWEKDSLWYEKLQKKIDEERDIEEEVYFSLYVIGE